MASTDAGTALEARLARIEALLATLYAIEGGVAQPEILRLLADFTSDPRQPRIQLALEQFAAIASQRRAEGKSLVPGEIIYGVKRLEERVDELRSRADRADASIAELQSRGEHFESSVSSLQEFMNFRLRQADRTVDELSFDAERLMTAFTLGVPIDEVPLRRTFPVRVYLSGTSGRRTTRISDAVSQLLESVGFDVARDLPAETGSWYKEWFARSQTVLTRPEVQERLRKLELSAELELITTKRAEADRNHAEGIASLIRALEGQDFACVQAGNILLVKATADGKASIVTRTLTEKEVAILERRPSLLRDPAHILEILGVNSHEESEAGLLQLGPGSNRQAAT